MTPSIEESVKIIKNEILTPDWGMTARRAERLKNSFAGLQDRYRNRKSIHDLLVMSNNVLAYIIKRKDFYPGAIDFLKESLAHVVDLHEDPTFDPDKDQKTLRTAL
ncbi:hypothetical protein ACFL6N_08050, partial [Thermodesulfobacteriota bacterium]